LSKRTGSRLTGRKRRQFTMQQECDEASSGEQRRDVQKIDQVRMVHIDDAGPQIQVDEDLQPQKLHTWLFFSPISPHRSSFSR